MYGCYLVFICKFLQNIHHCNWSNSPPFFGVSGQNATKIHMARSLNQQDSSANLPTGRIISWLNLPSVKKIGLFLAKLFFPMSVSSSPPPIAPHAPHTCNHRHLRQQPPSEPPEKLRTPPATFDPHQSPLISTPPPTFDPQLRTTLAPSSHVTV
uniref:Uncharacterized protein n=1 Tax=Cannabis sativa TaxID=3483 RepID=A0A803QAC6_CANSA